jgi:uncharacterized protein (DUF362 family)
MKRKEIALIKETRQKYFVQKIIEAIGSHLSVKPSDKVAIKINLSGSREIYSNTNYKTVESLITILQKEFGVSDISVIEGSDGAYFSGRTTWDIFYKFKYKEVELNGAKLVNLDELPHDKTLSVSTVSGSRTINYTQFESDYMISVVPPKTHNIFPVFISIPNLVGFVKPEERVLMFGASNSKMKKINFPSSDTYFQLIEYSGKNFTKLLKRIQPSLVIVDGLYGMEGRGPIKGSPVFHGFAIASEDVVLADSLTTYVMGFDVNDVSYLYFAFKEGLGNNRWQNVIGVDPPQVKFPYRPHQLYKRQKLWRDYYQKNGGRNQNRENPTGTNRVKNERD